MTKRRVGALALGILLLGGIGWYVWGKPSHPKGAHAAPPPDVPVTATAARVQDVPVFLDGLGSVQGLSTVSIRSQVSGVLVATPVREGQEVHKGDIIAEIDPRPYQAALDQATAKHDQDAAMLESQRLNLGRYQALEKQNYASRQQVDDQQATVNSQVAVIAADAAAVDAARINLEFCVIRAPIDGRVSLYQTFAGNVVQVSSQSGIVSITQDTPISVVLTLPEGSLPQVETAMEHGAVPVLVSNSGTSDVLAQGVLGTPDNTIDPTTGTIALKAQFPNDNHHLWPGQFVNARVQVAVLAHVVTLPVEAVEHGPQGQFVYVVKPDQTVDSVPVHTGYEDDVTTVITQGLSGGERVVVEGQSRLSPGTHVQVKDAPAAPAHAPTEAADGQASPT